MESSFSAKTSASQSSHSFALTCEIDSSQDFKAFCQIRRRISQILIVKGDAFSNGSKIDDATNRTEETIEQNSVRNN